MNNLGLESYLQRKIERKLPKRSRLTQKIIVETQQAEKATRRAIEKAKSRAPEISRKAQKVGRKTIAFTEGVQQGSSNFMNSTFGPPLKPRRREDDETAKYFFG